MSYSTNKCLDKHKAAVYDIHDYFGVNHILSAIERKNLSQEEITKLQVFSIKKIDYLIETDSFTEERNLNVDPDIVKSMESICKKLKENAIDNLINVDTDVLLEALELKEFTENQAEKLQEVVANKVRELN